MAEFFEEPFRNINADLLREFSQQNLKSLECSICQEIMSTPFMITTCGHSFCHGCLYDWLDNKLACPICRAHVRHPPVINQALRDIIRNTVEVLIKDDESRKDKITEFMRDKDERYIHDSKLKKKHFTKFFENVSEAVVDSSDGVPRCSSCHWEVHGSVCLNCGRHMIRGPGTGEGDDVFDSDSDGFAERSEDEDPEVDLEAITSSGRWNDMHYSYDEDEPNEEDDGFVDDRSTDEILESEENSSDSDSLGWAGSEAIEPVTNLQISETRSINRSRTAFRSRIPSTDESDDDEMLVTGASQDREQIVGGGTRLSRVTIAESGSDDEEPVDLSGHAGGVRGGFYVRRRTRRAVQSSEDEDDNEHRNDYEEGYDVQDVNGSNEDDENEDDFDLQDIAATTPQRRLLRSVYGDDDDEDEDEDKDEGGNYEEDRDSNADRHHSRIGLASANAIARARRVFPSSRRVLGDRSRRRRRAGPWYSR